MVARESLCSVYLLLLLLLQLTLVSGGSNSEPSSVPKPASVEQPAVSINKNRTILSGDVKNPQKRINSSESQGPLTENSTETSTGNVGVTSPIDKADQPAFVIQAKGRDATANVHHNASIVWFLVTVAIFGLLALRNRKQLYQLASWTKTSASPMYHRMEQMWESTSEQRNRWMPTVPSWFSWGRLRKLIIFPSLPIFYFQRPHSKTRSSKTKSEADIELVSIAYEYTPQLLNYRISPILSKPVAKELTKHLPLAMQLDDWKLLYSSNEHGSLLSTFYSKAIGRGPTVLIVKDESNAVFGAFLAESWRRGLLGNGQTFVFTVSPEMKVYKWSKKNSHFLSAQTKHIGFGGYVHSSCV
mmetsp:Transcript_39516/g.66235  ORF Transcript_39516/g.66235 Transcript_39516/m.66235 type:complete len:357 (-) Transcript_39516:595-1665(-)